MELILGLSVLLLWGSFVYDGLLVLVNFFSFDLVEVLNLVLVQFVFLLVLILTVITIFVL